MESVAVSPSSSTASPPSSSAQVVLLDVEGMKCGGCVRAVERTLQDQPGVQEACHVLKPQLKRVLNELGGRAQGIEIDIEADQAIAEQAGVNGTPTVQLFYQKELKQQWRGVKQRSEFMTSIRSLLPEG